MMKTGQNNFTLDVSKRLRTTCGHAAVETQSSLTGALQGILEREISPFLRT